MLCERVTCRPWISILAPNTECSFEEFLPGILNSSSFTMIYITAETLLMGTLFSYTKTCCRSHLDDQKVTVVESSQMSQINTSLKIVDFIFALKIR